MEFRKMVTMTLYARQWKKHVKNILLDSVGEGKGRMIWENSIETCILSYVKQMTSLSLMHETGALGQHRGMGWGFGMGGHIYTCGWFMSTYGKNHQKIVISLQLKSINYFFYKMSQHSAWCMLNSLKFWIL